MATLIVHPGLSQITYLKAAEVFQDLFSKITGIKPELSENDDGVSDLVVIGSDSVNDFLMGEVQELRIGSLGIRYGTDDYCIRTYKKDDRRVLILAGGRGRSTLYAVYDYFERFAGCHYFWDGDVIPACDHLPMENIQIRESPRFFYRGLRYFGHRGLKRFQAEHWSFEDWKQELDWLVKRRLNFFMMRIGMDDVWQRAFPDDVPYPEDFRTIDGVDAEEAIMSMAEDAQYRYGWDAGQILAKIHTIPAPTDAPSWETRFNAKIDRKIAMYENCELKYESGGDAFLDYLACNRHLLKDRPQSYQHGDYHIGNMMIDKDGVLTIIDFDRDDFGDPWEEFNRIVWCAQAAPAFASGMVDGYFDSNVPIEFWKLLALYICSNTLSSLPWAISFGEKEIRVMRKQAAQVLEWYDGMNNVVPTWYYVEKG